MILDCKDCPYKFLSQSHLDKHIKATHPLQPNENLSNMSSQSNKPERVKRSRRKNAGKNMAALLESEKVDDFNSDHEGDDLQFGSGKLELILKTLKGIGESNAKIANRFDEYEANFKHLWSFVKNLEGKFVTLVQKLENNKHHQPHSNPLQTRLLLFLSITSFVHWSLLYQPLMTLVVKWHNQK